MRLVIRPIKPAGTEYAEVTEEPIPTSLITYFEVRSFAFADRPTVDHLPVSVRLAAVANEVKSRLTLMSDLLRRLEVLGWRVQIVGDDVVVTTDLSVEEGWQTLRRQGVSDQLLPMLQKGSDLPPGVTASRRPVEEPPAAS